MPKNKRPDRKIKNPNQAIIQKARHVANARNRGLIVRTAQWLTSMVKAKVVSPNVMALPATTKDTVIICCEHEETPDPLIPAIGSVHAPGRYVCCARCEKVAIKKGVQLPHGAESNWRMFTVGSDLKPQKMAKIHVSLFLCVECSGPGSPWVSKLLEVGALCPNLERAEEALVLFHAVPGLRACDGCQLPRHAVGVRLLSLPEGITFNQVETGETTLTCKGCAREDVLPRELLRQYGRVVRCVKGLRAELRAEKQRTCAPGGDHADGSTFNGTDCSACKVPEGMEAEAWDVWDQGG